MNKLNQPAKKNVGLVGAICMLLSLPMFPLVALAEPPIKQFSPNAINCPPTSQTSQTSPSISPTFEQTTDSSVAPLTQKPIGPRASQPPLPSQQEAPVTSVLISGG